MESGFFAARRGTRPFGLLIAFLSIVAAGQPLSPCPSSAQDACSTRPTSPDVSTDREALYAELARDVAELEQRGAALRKVVLLVRPSVVHIEAEKSQRDEFVEGGHQFVEEAGSGVIVRLRGQHFVLTNRHVIRDAELDRIKVCLADGRRLFPTRKWSDRSTDVAVLAVKAPGLIPARLGESDKVEIGDFVLAFGSPFGLSHSVTHGIISAKGRRDLQLGRDDVKIQDFLQTDAAINPGNSGGPLLNLRGEVIGINTAIASNSGGNEGIGFSIPIKMAMFVAHHLVHEGTLVRAYLGVQLDAKFQAAHAGDLGLPNFAGTRVTGVSPGSPAAEANLQRGDVILMYDGVQVEDDSHLVNLVGLSEIGRQIELLVYREGRPLTIRVTVRPRDSEARVVRVSDAGD